MNLTAKKRVLWQWGAIVGVVILMGMGSSWYSSWRLWSQRTQELEASLLSLYPIGVSVSPQNHFLLTKRRNARSFDLIIRDIQSGTVIAQTTSHNTQLALTWAPDESAIVFLENDDSSNQLTLRSWRFRETAQPKPLPFATLSAILPIRWAPSGRALLLYRGNGDVGELTLVEGPLEASPKVTPLGTMSHGGDMRWSPDSSRVAFTTTLNSGTIDIVDVITALPRKTVVVQPGARISSIAWSPSGNELFVTARAPEDEFYSLFRIDLTSEVSSRLLQAPYDLHNPIVSVDGTRVALEANKDGRSEVVIGDTRNGAVARRVTGAHESVRLVSTSHDIMTLHVHGGPLNQSPTVFLMDWEGGTRSIPGQATVTGSTPSLIAIPTSDDQKVPTIVWSDSSQARNVKRGVVYVHGGPHLQERPVVDGRVLPLMLRDSVVAIPNYRGSSGYGASWEKVEDFNQQALDVAAVVNHLKQTFGLSSDQIIVVTSSTGLRPVFSFLRTLPNSFGTLVLTALVSADGGLCSPRGFEGAMYGFHGGRDPILSPHDAERVFLSCSESAKTRAFQVFSNEGHLFHRTASWAEVFAAVYKD